jgi:putative endonuclease
MQFFYTYILQSISDPAQFYVGSTEDLHARLKKHNAGEVPHSAKYRPWQIKTAIAFTALERARQFERYLKTASGRICKEAIVIARSAPNYGSASQLKHA